MSRYRRAQIQRWPPCATCKWPLHPAAAAGGFTTHPGCDATAPQAPLATVHQLPIDPEEGTDR